MAGRLLALSGRALIKAPRVPYSIAGSHGHGNPDPYCELIGNREVVGYGFNGQPFYADRDDFPMPAIRWREPTNEIKALREKEKGDWKQLSLEEKKALYRYSFRQTFSEFKAPTGEWKSVVGIGLILCSMALWFMMGIKTFVYSPLPDSFSEESQKAQLRRMLDARMNPIEGISSEWDYEKNDWKK